MNEKIEWVYEDVERYAKETNSDLALAKKLGVAKSTVQKYKVEDTEFLLAITRGKQEAQESSITKPEKEVTFEVDGGIDVDQTEQVTTLIPADVESQAHESVENRVTKTDLVTVTIALEQRYVETISVIARMECLTLEEEIVQMIVEKVHLEYEWRNEDYWHNATTLFETALEKVIKPYSWGHEFTVKRDDIFTLIMEMLNGKQVLTTEEIKKNIAEHLLQKALEQLHKT